MKTNHLILACALSLFGIVLQSSANAETKDVPVRSIHQGGEIPRIPAMVPIVCYADTDVSCIYISFLFNMGDVDIIIENQSTGENTLSTVDSSLGGAIIPFSGSSGEWVITFTLDSGVEYEGEFEI